MEITWSSRVPPSAVQRPDAELKARLRRAFFLLSKLIIPAVFVTLAVVNVQFLDRMPNFCIYRGLFGVRCLGCGMTHAFCSVLHGHFAAAFAYNPLVIVAFPFFGKIGLLNLRSFITDVRRGF